MRAQRLQDISEEDARDEGAEPIPMFGRVSHVAAFSYGWDRINGKRGYSWASRPWVWALTFKVAK